MVVIGVRWWRLRRNHRLPSRTPSGVRGVLRPKKFETAGTAKLHWDERHDLWKVNADAAYHEAAGPADPPDAEMAALEGTQPRVPRRVREAPEARGQESPQSE